jgi:hypothetical protein
MAVPARRQAQLPETAGALPRPARHASLDSDLQLYERTMEMFDAGNFQAARKYFLRLTNSTNRDLAYIAGQRVKMCDRRLATAESTALDS